MSNWPIPTQETDRNIYYKKSLYPTPKKEKPKKYCIVCNEQISLGKYCIDHKIIK